MASTRPPGLVRPSTGGHLEGTDQSQPLLHSHDGNSGQTLDGEEGSKTESGDIAQGTRYENRGLLHSSEKDKEALDVPPKGDQGLPPWPPTASSQNESCLGDLQHAKKLTKELEENTSLDSSNLKLANVGNSGAKRETSSKALSGQPRSQGDKSHNARQQSEPAVNIGLNEGSSVKHVFPKTSPRNAKKVTPRPGLPNFNTKSDHSNRFLQSSDSMRGDIGLGLPGSRPTSGVLQIVPEDDREDDVFSGSDEHLEEETSFTNAKMQNKVSPSVVLNIDHPVGESNRMGISEGIAELPKSQGSRFLEVPKADGLPHWNPANDPTRPERRRTLANLSPKQSHPVPQEGVYAPQERKSSLTYHPERKSSLTYHPPIVQMRRPSKTYTVIHYGNVGKEASTTVPTGHEQVDRLDFFDLEARNGDTLDIAQDSQKQIARQLSRQLSEDRQSIISLGGKGQRQRLLSIQHVSQPDLRIPDTPDADDAPDTGQTDITITIESPQHTYNASRVHKDKNVQAMVEMGKMYAMRKRNRLVHKDGNINVRPANISKRACQFLLDIFTTLLDLSWRWVWSLFIIAFVLSWFVFAIIWWLIGYANGDFQELVDSERPEKCVAGIVDFPSAFLFSIETQHTIGYGTRAVTTQCPAAFIMIMVQSLLGVVIQCVLAGVVFAKLAKPKNRSETIMFSKKAVISIEDGCYCLVFRVGDMRRSQLIGCNLHAFLVREHVTKEGRRVEFQREHLEVLSESEDYDQYLFLAWPTKIIHRITPLSPLWDVSRDSLLAEQFEIIVVLEGTIESSGMITQIRTSYLPSEIEWGQRFQNLLTDQKSGGVMEIDYSNFSRTEVQLEMPDVSAHTHQQSNTTGANLQQRQLADRRMSHRSSIYPFFRGY